MMSTSGVEERSPPKVEVHLAAMPGHDAFEPWRASLSWLFDSALTAEGAYASFRGDVAGYHLGDSLIFRSSSIGHRLVRDRSRVRRTAIDHIMIEYQTRGLRRGEFDGRAFEMQPGDIGFTDFARPLRSEEPDFSRISLIVPRDRLPAALRERDLHGLVLDGTQGATRLLARYIEGLVETAGELAIEETDAAVAAAFALVEGALGDSSPLRSRQHPAASPPLRHLATAHVDRNLSSRSLTPQAVAAALRLSRATLYRLFEADGGVRAFILARRLDRAFAVLAAARRGEKSIGGTAFAHGFASESHFSRAFRARFGISPNEALGMGLRYAEPGKGPTGLASLPKMEDWIRTLGQRRPATLVRPPSVADAQHLARNKQG